MNIRLSLGLLTLIPALVLSACGGAPVAEVPTAAPQPVVPQSTAAPTAQPTPTFEPVTDAEPTVAALPTAPAVQASGTLGWRDQILRNDAVIVSVNGLTPEPGQVYAAWLSGTDTSLPLGALQEAGNGALGLTYVSPTQANLLGAYERVYITQAPQAAATTEITNVLLSGSLPEKALVHIRHVLFSIGNTPNKIGFALGLRQETDELLRHAQFLKDALDAGDLALEKVHAEHIVNIIDGSQARDLNGDGRLQNPGDGYGLLPNGQQDGYIKGMNDHARLAAEAPDATEAIKLHAGHVQIAGENARARIQEIHGLAENIAAASAVDATQLDVLKILALSQQTIQGIDANGDEQIDPTPGEGGVLTAYQHAQLMANIALTPANGAEVPEVAQPQPAAPAAQPDIISIEIGDNTFSPNKITVPVGATVVWTNNGQRPHTVTADDGSFKSATLNNGDTFKFTFEQAGTFPYFCEFHGGKGGEGMAATIIVADQSAAQPAAPPAPTQAAAPTQASQVQVAIGDNTFTAKEVSVPVGATVVWTNNGQRPHTVTADDGAFASGTLNAGASFTRTFDKPGVYPYFCEFHGGPGGQGMAGVIRVGDAAQSQPANATSPASGSQDHSGDGQHGPTQPPATPTEAPAAAAPTPATVAMLDFAFEPQEITVKAGTTITWRNNGAKKHSATAVDKSFDTGLFGTGESQSVTFDSPGTYVYFCQLHGAPDGTSGMVGTVIVE